MSGKLRPRSTVGEKPAVKLYGSAPEKVGTA
jgi:hypothetical protein